MVPRPRSFLHAWNGIRVAAGERNFRFHLVALVAVVGTGIFVQLDRVEWALVLLACGSVLSMEAMNTALERACDAFQPGHHPLVGLAKDAAAAAVLIASVFAAVVGILVFLPALERCLG